MNRLVPFGIFLVGGLLSSGLGGIVFGFNLNPAFWFLASSFFVPLAAIVAFWFNRTHTDWFTSENAPVDLQAEEQPAS